MAPENAAINMNPSPKNVRSKLSPVPVKFTTIKPANPIKLPTTFFVVNFSCLNPSAQINIVKNVPAPVMIDDLTPVVCASPM